MHTSRTRYFSVASAVLIATGALRAQSPLGSRVAPAKAAVDRIRAEDILRDVSYLASDANMGRRTPFPGLASPGYDSAAAYVARFLGDMHVKPMADNVVKELNDLGNRLDQQIRNDLIANATIDFITSVLKDVNRFRNIVDAHQG